jgi:hypothetical protein
MKGIRHYQSDAGIHIVRVHYTADPDKDPATVKGAEWFQRSLKGYTGGTKSSAWRQEMEIDWDATGGDLVFPQLEIYQEKIFINPFTIPDGWELYASFDYGHRNPSAFEVFAIDYDSNVYAIWEYYVAGKGYRSIAQSIRACSYWDKMKFSPIADPSIWAKNQQVAGADNNEMKSVAQLFIELPSNEQVIFMPGKAGGDITVAEKINGFLWNEDELKQGNRPRFFIFKTCPMLMWELLKIRYKDYSDTMQEQRNLQEDIVDKDNHAFDATKMFLNMFFPNPEEKDPPKFQRLKEMDRASYDEWKSVAKMHGEMQPKGGMGEFE